MDPDKRVEKLERSHIPQIKNIESAMRSHITTDSNGESAVRSHLNPDKRADNQNPFAHTGAKSPYLKVQNDRFSLPSGMKRSPQVSLRSPQGALRNFSQ
jgi:hypothetical protein